MRYGLPNSYWRAQRAYDNMSPPEDDYPECDECDGEGMVGDDQCPKCKGYGVLKPTEELDIPDEY